MYTQIVVGTDGSTRAEDAVRRAGDVATTCGLEEIHVVSACSPYPLREIERIRREIPEEFHDIVDPMVEANNNVAAARVLLNEISLRVVPHARTGDAADAVLSVAEELDADLIVVGARGLGAIGRFLRGSVSTKVAHHAPCDVLIVEHGE